MCTVTGYSLDIDLNVLNHLGLNLYSIVSAFGTLSATRCRNRRIAAETDKPISSSAAAARILDYHICDHQPRAAIHSAIVRFPLLRLHPEQSNCRLSG